MNKTVNIVSIVFLLIGVVCLAISFFIVPQVLNYDGKIDTKATITEIKRIDHGSDDSTYEVYVTHTVDGVEYTGRLSGYSSSYRVGKTIDIYYDEKDPTSVGSKGLDKLVFILPAIGLIFTLVGGGLLFKGIKRKNDIKKLKTTGMLIYANYIETRINYSIAVNNRNPYQIVCQWIDPSDNMTYEFVSDDIWMEPSQTIMSLGITTFPVYIDPQNKKRYVVDTLTVLPNIK